MLTGILIIKFIVLGQTVPGTYPPVQQKYWAPVQRGTSNDPGSGKENPVKLRREKRTEKSNETSGMDTISDSGVVKWVGNKTIHNVTKGETLWNLSAKYFGDPWYWPRIWSWNPHITNPHWLFPGTRVFLSKNAARVNLKTSVDQSDDGFSGLSFDKNTVTIRKQAWIEENEIENANIVIGSPEEKTLLSSGDLIYLKLGKKQPAIGEIMTIFRMEKKVVDPETKKSLGQVVKILGEVIIKEIRPKNYAIGRISSVLDTIKRNDLVYPLKRRYSNVRPLDPPVGKEYIKTGKILYSLKTREMLSSGNIVVMNLGKRDKVKKGHKIKIIHQGDGLFSNLHPLDPEYRVDSRFPIEKKGEIVVFHVGEKYSLGIIIKTFVPVRINDTVVFGEYPDKYKESSEKKKVLQK
ncbi:MAG: LysM peptidoglycan-binding domain-containing protein [Deltaproteobacteria bacterium]|nr:LysM peptidoglycan-binding domain-containing protein [Deltaproteobacteria bacterium]